jgi:hypothetical protein
MSTQTNIKGLFKLHLSGGESHVGEEFSKRYLSDERSYE